MKTKICTESGQDLIPSKRLEVSDIDDTFIHTFTDNVLKFQKEVSKGKKVDEYKDYIDFANQEDSSLDMSIELEPTFLVAPYFYLDIDWLDINIRLISKAKELAPTEKKVFAQIVIDKKIFERATMGYDEDFNRIIDAYKNSSADGFLLWIDGYSEHEEISYSLKKYIDFLKRLKGESQKIIYSLY